MYQQRKFIKRLDLFPLAIVLFVFSSHCFASGSDSTLYTNAQVYTLNPKQPWANSLLVEDGVILFVGDFKNIDPSKYSIKVDLSGRFVMPGFVDAHTHPGLVALLRGGINGNGAAGPHFPSDSKESFFEALKAFARSTEFKSAFDKNGIVITGDWSVAHFLPEGPDKNDLDDIFGDAPVMLMDDTGHSMWLNSAALSYFNINKSSPDLSTDISYFVRNKSGELTGWVKEWALMQEMLDEFIKANDNMNQNIKAFINFLSQHGVTTLFDAGTFKLHDRVYSFISDLEKSNQLPLRYEGSYHIYSAGQIDIAISELLKLRKLYGGKLLTFNTIKIHYDGIEELGTAGMLEQYQIDAPNRGGLLFDAERLSKFILELEKAHLNLHFHAVGSRAIREILDAVELAKQLNGGILDQHITISHVTFPDKTDLARFKELGVTASYTPHWFGGNTAGGPSEMQLGKDRVSQRRPTNSLVKLGTNVTLSSDVISKGSHKRANPFIGIEVSMTRRNFGWRKSPMIGQASELLSLESAIAGYTLNGGIQLGRASEIGSLKTSARADFIVLPINPFDVKVEFLHTLVPDIVIMGGNVVSGDIETSQ